MTAKKANTSRQNYTSDLIQRALNDIENNGLSQRKTAEKYDIPLSTLNDAYNKVRSSHKIGRKPILSEEIEEILYQILIRLSDVGVTIGLFKREKKNKTLSFAYK
jgi:transposase